MGKLSLSRVFAMTPEGAMGMPDSRVKTGAFDKPGTMSMGSIGMGKTKVMEKIKHASDRDMEKSGHAMAMPSKVLRNGKKYGTDFRPLASDVSSFKNLAVDGMDPRRPWPPYKKLRSPRPTAFAKGKSVREIRLTLDGDMKRYVWFLNNKPLSESDVIRIRRGEVVRFIMINRTMMHHPMHLHGHFFRVINGQGDHSPLKHTVNVAPMSTTIIEFDANELGDWFFHCHLLYHMKSGMARVVHYEDYTLDSALAEVRPKLWKENWYLWAEADALSNMSQGFFTFSDTRNIFTSEWEIGWEEVDKTEWETILTYDRKIYQPLSHPLCRC